MTLVSIVGDFHSSVLPIFYHFRNDIKTHVILFDDFKRDVVQAKKIVDGTTEFIKKNALPIKSYALQINEDSIESLEKTIELLTQMSPDPNKLHINVTDGLTSVALYLSNKLLAKGVKFISYDKYDNNYNVFSSDALGVNNRVDVINIRDHFMLKNVTILDMQNKALADKLEDELILFFESCSANKTIYDERSFDPQYYIQTTATGFLYEMYVYNLVKRLNIDDIEIGVKVTDVYNNDAFVTNEFDILIMKNNHLHMIECKFQTEIKKVELVYKADSVKSTLDDESKILILSNENTYDAQEIIQSNAIYKRSNAKKIYLRGSPLQDIPRFIKEIDAIFDLNTDNLDALLQEGIKKDKKQIVRKKTKQEELHSFLSERFELEIDFFNKKDILALLNYKITYRNNPKVCNAMDDTNLKQLIRFINRMINSKSQMDIEFLYKYYKKIGSE